MTIEDRFVVDLADVLNVRIECRTCGASIAVNPSKWGDLPFSCPGCHMHWHMGDHEPAYRAVNALRVALKGVIALAETEQLAYRLRFEIEKPKG